MPDHVDRDLDMLQRPTQLLRDFLVLPGLEQPQMVRDDLPGDAALAVPCPRSAVSRHSRRSRAPTPAGSSDCTTRSAASTSAGSIRQRRRSLRAADQIAVFIQIADDRHGGVAHFLRHHLDRELRLQMIGQRDGRRKGTSQRTAFRPIPRPGSCSRDRGNRRRRSRNRFRRTDRMSGSGSAASGVAAVAGSAARGALRIPVATSGHGFHAPKSLVQRRERLPPSPRASSRV